MSRALALADRGRGMVGTNPPVGALVARGGRILAEGWHGRFGGPHAEAVALSRAGNRARGSTVYVTLEPCSRTGKTPPCTRMLAASGVSRVVYSIPDPNEAGRGAAEMRRAGIRVTSGVLAKEGSSLVREFLVRRRTRRPYLVLKLAMTADGRIADAAGKSRWISSARARGYTRSLRSAVDAVMVGGGTASADDPRLTAPGKGRPRWRIVVDGQARLKPSARVLRGAGALVACNRTAPGSRLLALRRRGAEILVLPGTGNRVNLDSLMKALLRLGVGSIICEGGARLAGGLLDAGLVDRVVLVHAPRLLGGADSLPAVLGAGRPLGRAIRLKGASVRTLGGDIMVEADVESAGRR